MQRENKKKRISYSIGPILMKDFSKKFLANISKQIDSIRLVKQESRIFDLAESRRNKYYFSSVLQKEM
jgi:hypothetical protein